MILENETIQLRPYILEKDNLTLRREYLEWIQDYNNIEYINSISLLMNDSLDFIESSFSRFTSKNSQGFFIYHKSSKKFIGTAKLDKIDFFRQSGEFGIMIGEQNFKRQNIGTLSMELILDYSFRVLGLHRVWGGCAVNNIGMQKLFEKFNFKEEGRQRESIYINGIHQDGVLYGLLNKEYKEKYNDKM